MSRALDGIYRAAGYVSAMLILAICLLVSAQIVLNGMGRVMPGVLPSTIPSYADFAGFMLAGATFLAMAYTLRSGGHIRVTLFVQRMGRGATLVLEALALAVAIGFVGYALYFSGALVMESLHYGDVSNGIIPVPLYLPQGVMTFGIGLLFLALVQSLLELIVTRQPVLHAAEEM